MDLFPKKSVDQIMAQASKDADSAEHISSKHLGVRDLTAFGIAAIIGAGIFSTIGNARNGGPGVIFLFLYCHRLWFCGFCLCRIRIHGSCVRKHIPIAM